jgi:hypothetical protein
LFSITAITGDTLHDLVRLTSPAPWSFGDTKDRTLT